MAKHFICGEETYEISEEKPTIGLPVEISGLPESIESEGETLIRRSNFHVSLVCIEQIIKKHNVADSDFVERAESKFCEFVAENPIEFVRFSNEFRFVRLEERASVVAMCEVSNLARFFDVLNDEFSLAVEYPPTHVTLFTKQPNAGIYLTDSADLLERSVIVPRPDGVSI